MDSRLRKWRKGNGLTLDDAANIFGCSVAKLSLLERGWVKPDIDLFAIINKKTGGKITISDFRKGGE